MFNIVIGIPTFKRQGMLKKLILSIINSNKDSSLIKSIYIIVADNDIDRTAETVLVELSKEYKDTYKLIYYNYPIKGISNIRNFIFQCALQFKPDYIVSVDDDEYVTSEWLNQLILTITSNKGDLTMGPVIPEIQGNVSPGISYSFQRSAYTNNQKLDFFESCNYIISTDFLIKNKLEFDNRFNLTGSGDSYFGVIAVKKGANIYWAGDAKVYETISEKRATLNWLIQRNYRAGLQYTHIQILENKYLNILKKLLVNVTYIIAGTFSLFLLPFRSKYKYWGILKISQSVGSFAGLAGIKYYEYQVDKKV